AVLYGSAAEGRLRPTSDLNLILVLSAFDPARLDGLREPLAFSQAAIQLAVMFLLQPEIPSLLEDFPVKVAEILMRWRILHGPDPFADVRVSPAAERSEARRV